MTATSTTALVPLRPAFSDAERLALAGFLAGYRGLTREAYALDLRQFTSWCRARSLSLFAVRRADIEGFARDLPEPWLSVLTQYQHRNTGVAPVRDGCAAAVATCTLGSRNPPSSYSSMRRQAVRR